MPVKVILRCVIAFAVAAPLYALAGSLNAKPGAWEITTTTLMQGVLIPPDVLANMPPEQRDKIEQTMQARAGKPVTRVRQSCITQQNLDEDLFNTSDEGHGQCKKKVVTKSENKLVLERICPAPQALTMKLSIEARTPESLVATTDLVQAGGGKIHMDIKGRWLGASCSGIKEHS